VTYLFTGVSMFKVEV